jgi:hypothetical protein
MVDRRPVFVVSKGIIDKETAGDNAIMGFAPTAAQGVTNEKDGDAGK